MACKKSSAKKSGSKNQVARKNLANIKYVRLKQILIYLPFLIKGCDVIV